MQTRKIIQTTGPPDTGPLRGCGCRDFRKQRPRLTPWPSDYGGDCSIMPLSIYSSFPQAAAKAPRLKEEREPPMDVVERRSPYQDGISRHGSAPPPVGSHKKMSFLRRNVTPAKAGAGIQKNETRIHTDKHRFFLLRTVN